ncbi:MAG: hypothetical protein IK093_08980 [Ruminiclostridium sp.]|nr:hypothetical protein [Ruminiclostridium sp.]
MYRCERCGREFDEPGTYKDYRGEYWGVPCWEDMPCCPYCESGDFDNIESEEYAWPEEEEEEYDDDEE